MKPCKSNHRKAWSRVVDNPFASLKLGKVDWPKNILVGSSSLREFPDLTESITRRESKKL